MRATRSLAALALPVTLALAGCSYAPPANTDVASARHQTDYDACDGSVADKVDRQNAKTGLSWFGGGFTRWPRIDAAMKDCMEAKGWGHTRACTAEELRAARPGSLTVTRDGVRCTVPNKA